MLFLLGQKFEASQRGATKFEAVFKPTRDDGKSWAAVNDLLRRGGVEASSGSGEAAALELPGALHATHLYISPTTGVWQAALCAPDEFAGAALSYLGAECGEREVVVVFMSTFRLNVVRVEALLDLSLAASRGLHSGSQVFDEDRRLAAETAGGLVTGGEPGCRGPAPEAAVGGSSPTTFGFGRQIGDFSVGAFGRAGSALGGGSPVAHQGADGASAPATPTPGTAWSFGAAVRQH